MMMNLMIVLLSMAFFVYTNATLGANTNKLANPVADAKPEVQEVLNIMKRHFDLSLDYLYTGVQFASQDGERPGLAKKLRDMSDAQWEAGMAALNKYLEHGGTTIGDDSLVKKLNFEGGQKARLNLGSSDSYLDTIKTLSNNSNDTLTLYNDAYKMAYDNKNGDIAHYLEEKIEKEIEHRHELQGHITNLNAMKGIGAAVALFDSNL